MGTTTDDKSNTGPTEAEKIPPPAPPKPADKVSPFAANAYPLVSTDVKFQAALQAAHDAQKAAGLFGPNSAIAISMIALATNGNHKYAGLLDDRKHFSASLLKVAAMYCAHELLAAARRLAQRKNFVDANSFIAACSMEFDAQIAAKAPAIVKALVIDPATTPPMGHAPRYADLFQVDNASFGQAPTLSFLPTFQADLESMIEHGTNEGASHVIRKLSYDYINAALLAGGFFFPAKNTKPEWGIWLAGDYVGDHNKPQYANKNHVPYARIDCENDCFTRSGVKDCADAQISATKLMANLMALIKLGRIPAADRLLVHDTDPDITYPIPETCLNMKDLLSEPKPPPESDYPWMDPRRMVSAVPKFKVTHDKVGFANLKPDPPTPGPNVYSEGLVIEWTNPGDTAALGAHKLSGRIAISWQNLVGPLRPKFYDGICRMINDAYFNFISGPP